MTNHGRFTLGIPPSVFCPAIYDNDIAKSDADIKDRVMILVANGIPCRNGKKLTDGIVYGV
jgi:hypothetical protein